MRIFINSSLGSELKAYSVNAENVKRSKVMITRMEADSFKFGGAWALYRLMEQERAKKLDTSEFFRFGCLGEEEQDFYKFTTYYVRIGSPRPFELPLPDKATLQELGLT